MTSPAEVMARILLLSFLKAAVLREIVVGKPAIVKQDKVIKKVRLICSSPSFSAPSSLDRYTLKIKLIILVIIDKIVTITADFTIFFISKLSLMAVIYTILLA